MPGRDMAGLMRGARGGFLVKRGFILPILLKAIGPFNSADFFSLYDHDAEILGPDMLAREELTLVPGESREMRHRLMKP